MFCSKCGKEIDDNTKICLNCGCAVSEIKKNASPNGCLISFLVFVVLSIFIGIVSSISESSNILNDCENKQTNHTRTEDSSNACIPLDKQTYNSIKVGGSYKQLNNLKNYCGEVVSETQIDNYSGGMVVFYGKPIGSNANFTIMNGQIIGKSQIGLE